MVTASVVLYNTEYMLFKELLQSYAPSNGRRLYIIDNSKERTSYCESIEDENIRYFFNGKNIGYGAAHNIGIQQAIDDKSDYHIILNPDIKFNSSIVEALISYADVHRDVVYMLPKVIYPDGTIQLLCKLLPTPFDLLMRRFLPCIGFVKRRNDRYVLSSFGYDRIINPPCLSGCFMFLRTDTLREYGLRFDERFFMYCEDFDLIRRLHRVGKTVFYPDVQIVHRHERSSYKSWKMLAVHIKSACMYFNKYGWFIDNERRYMNRQILKEMAVQK